MADIPQEVREAAMSDHERFIVAVAYDCGYQAGLAAGKRAGMERAAEIADDHGTAWGLAGGTSATVIAQAIRSENVNVFPATNDEDFAESAKRLSEICGQEE